MAELPEQRIIPIDISDEMRSAYIDYSMSVIVSRALPDVRDGLKPVQRRVLYGMSDLGLTAGSSFRKCARVVGDVLGKYHPHGDSAVYDAMVRMAQGFNLRYPLVDGQGNFGSIDGDSAAAMRYTEARMARIAQELLRDINKETVDQVPNFDESLEEPIVLPAAVPNLLMNGASGIAVGMATNIPPHNLGEVIDGVLAYIENPDLTIEDLTQSIPAPDFPTGGTIYGYTGIREAYHTGRGRVVMRARIHEEEVHGRQALIITEIPYQVNKSSLMEKIAGLIRDKRIDGIHDLRDESDRDGMRIVVELKRDAIPMIVQNQLYKYSQLQQTFGVNMVALVDGRPRLLNLKEVIAHYVNHRHNVVTRRTTFDLRKAEERAHILAGLVIALDHLDAVISIIRYSPDVETAQKNLENGVIPSELSPEMRRRFELPLDEGSLFSLSEIQAKAILDLRLARLTGLEREKIEKEYRDVLIEIDRLKEILARRELRMQIIRDELVDIKERYNDDRRTRIDYTGGDEINLEDLIEDESMIVTISHEGLIKRTPVGEYRAQGRGGRGLRGASTRDEDYVEQLYHCSAHDYLLFFTDRGKCYWLRVFRIPEGARTAKGRSIRNLIQLPQDDSVRTVLAVSKKDFEDPAFTNRHFVVMASQKGLVKKTVLSAFSRPRVDGIIAIAVNDDDKLLRAVLTDGKADIILASSEGLAIRFHETDVRAMGRNTLGVRGMRLPESHYLIGMVVQHKDEEFDILTISKHGAGKRTSISEYPVQARGGKGVITQKTTDRTGSLVGIRGVTEENDLMIITTHGIMIRLSVSGISRYGRNTQGVRLINLGNEDTIADVTLVATDEEVEVEREIHE